MHEYHEIRLSPGDYWVFCTRAAPFFDAEKNAPPKDYKGAAGVFDGHIIVIAADDTLEQWAAGREEMERLLSKLTNE